MTSSSTITSSSRVISTHIVREPSVVTSHLRSKQLRSFYYANSQQTFLGFGVNKALRSKHIFIAGISNNNNNNNNNNNKKTIALRAILKKFLKKGTRRKMQLLTEGQNYVKSALLGSATI